MTIHAYGLCYWLLPYAKDTIDRALELASEPVHFTVVEGKSHNSPEFLEWGKQYLREGKIQRYIQAEGNCRGTGLNWAMKNFPPDDSEDFVIVTDLDLHFMQDVDWIKTCRDTMKDHVVSGWKLSPLNYESPNYGWHTGETSWGCWWMSLRWKHFKKYLDSGLAFQDHIVINHMRQYGKGAQVQSLLYHHGWNSMRTGLDRRDKYSLGGDPEYWAAKNQNWQEKYTGSYSVFTKENI